jgi:tRNA dimethylallyltransferase
VLVGGTGFYLRGLLEGLSPGPTRDDALRARLLEREKIRPGSVHRILTRLDPVSGARIHPNDKNKTLRALEIRLLEGATLSSMFERGRDALSDYRPVKIGLDPASRMFDGGLLNEVRGLLSSGIPAGAKPFESLGYKQALQVLQGQITAEQALESTQLETRRYAKRQLTWFRKEQGVHWIAGFGEDPRVQEEVLAILQRASVG